MKSQECPPYIWEFIKLLAPEAPELYMSCFSEETCIKDATELIRSLTTERKGLRELIVLIQKLIVYYRTHGADAWGLKMLDDLDLNISTSLSAIDRTTAQQQGEVHEGLS
jgi:hypothetical protein